MHTFISMEHHKQLIYNGALDCIATLGRWN